MNALMQNPRPRTTKLIEDMLEQRKQMLILLAELSRQGRDDAELDVNATLDDFLGVLVDYIAAGHFGLYERIAEGTERRKPVVETAQEIYTRIAETTGIAVEFSEKYEAADDIVIESALAADLSALGEEIATRIELEDKLILAMLGTEYRIPPLASQTAAEE